MVAKLMKLLSGVAALAGRRLNNPPVEPVTDDLAVLEEKYRSMRDTTVALIRERRELQKRVQRLESMSDADRAGEHAAELDRVKSILRDRYGLNLSRMQIAAAVSDLSDRFEEVGVAMQEMKEETSAWSRAIQYTSDT